MNRTFLIGAAALIAAYFVGNSPQKHLLVLVQTTELFDQSLLRHVGNLKTALKVLDDISEHVGSQEEQDSTVWDYVLVTQPFKDKAASLHFANRLQRLPFVVKHKTFSFTTRPLHMKLFNGYLSVKKALYANMGWLPERPLPQMKSDDVEDLGLADLVDRVCSDVNMINKEDDLVVNIIKVTDEDAMDQYNSVVVHKLFPLIGTRIDVAGQADSEFWTMIAIVRYRDRQSFCEMAMSQTLADILPHKVKAVQTSYTLLTREMKL